MASTTALVPVEEYLRTSYKPACEYLDGVLRQKPMPTFKHSLMEFRVCELIKALNQGYIAVPEQTVMIRPSRYLIPDVAVQRLTELQEPYPAKPIALCVEVLSPEDRFSDVSAKCEQYHDWGVPICWIIDPERRQCWQYVAGQRPQEISLDGKLLFDELQIHASDLFQTL